MRSATKSLPAAKALTCNAGPGIVQLRAVGRSASAAAAAIASASSVSGMPAARAAAAMVSGSACAVMRAGYRTDRLRGPGGSGRAPDGAEVVTYIVLLIVLLALSAFFSSAETAYFSAEGVRLDHERRRKLPGAERAAALLANPRRLLASILLGNNLINTGAAAVGTALVATWISGGAGLLIATILVTALLVIFGEIGPKSLALHHNLRVARLYSLPMTAWTRLAAPAVFALDAFSRWWIRLTSGEAEARTALTLGEIRTAISLSREHGELEREDTSVLLGALRLAETQVRRIMTARVQFATIDAEQTLAAAARAFGAAGFQRLPVTAIGAPSQLAGYLHGADVLKALGEGGAERKVREVMREALIDSERASVQQVLARMQRTGDHLTLLVDEFGDVSGLVTLEDVLELVVGNIRSEMGSGEEPVRVRIAGEALVEGQRSLTDLAVEFELELESEEAETAAGMLINHFHRIPRAGEALDLHGHRWTVRESDERRITLIGFRKLGEAPSSTGDGDGPA